MEVNIDQELAFKIAGKDYIIKDRSRAQNIRDEFIGEFKDILREHGACYGFLEYNALEQNYKYILGFELSDDCIIKNNNFTTYKLKKNPYLEVNIEDKDLENGYKYAYESFFPNKKYFHGLGPDVEFFQYDRQNDDIGQIKLFIALKENPNV